MSDYYPYEDAPLVSEPDEAPGTCRECGCDLTAQEATLCSVCYRRLTTDEAQA